MQAGTGAGVLSVSSGELDVGIYKPRTAETKQTYEVILAFIQDALGDQVDTIICQPSWEINQLWEINHLPMRTQIFDVSKGVVMISVPRPRQLVVSLFPVDTILLDGAY